MTKIKKLTIKGIRGIRSEISLDLNGSSILLYGDNGSGKSSITDAIEWFFLDRIEHLACEGIGKNGIEGIRCSKINEDAESEVGFEFSDQRYNSVKKICLKKGKLHYSCNNKSDEFIGYLESSTKENLILRYQDLRTFIDYTKTDKLDKFSNIIGFSEVFETRGILISCFNEVKREIKNKNFEEQINTKQNRILQTLGQNLTSDEQFITLINELLAKLKIVKTLSSINEIDNIIQVITSPEDTEKTILQVFYQKISDTVNTLSSSLEDAHVKYTDYYQKYHNIVTDIEKINKIVLEKLLSEGRKLLEGTAITENVCPLCLQPKNLQELQMEIEHRIKELILIKQEKKKLESIKDSLSTSISNSIQQIGIHLADKNMGLAGNEDIKTRIQQIEDCLKRYQIELEIDITSGKAIKRPDELMPDSQLLIQIQKSSDTKGEILRKEYEGNLRQQTSKNIIIAKEAYADFKKLSKEKEIMASQLRTLEVIKTAFIAAQKQSLGEFLSAISYDLNKIYQFMHPGEKVNDIQLSLVTNDDEELTGINIRYKFYDEDASPPQKYLSESHLNCLGIALFFSSVIAFNNNNKFFILDDVISSLDTAHRKRFADLLVERFPDYQIVVLTHEKSWYDIVHNLIKGRWKVGTIKYTNDQGTFMDEPPLSLKERMEEKIRKRDETDLGNDIRKYLESILKGICQNLEVKMKYLPNERNEERMSSEMLSDLRSKIIGHKCTELKDNPLFGRLMSSVFIGNRDSHDNPVHPVFDDFTAFWKDVVDFEKLFICPVCNKIVSLRNYDRVLKKIRCNCGGSSYDWKED